CVQCPLPGSPKKKILGKSLVSRRTRTLLRLCQNGGVREPRMNHLRGSLFLLAVVCVVGAAQAQVVTSNLQGVVTDPTGAVVANAVITATNVETAVHRTATTNGEGFYRFNL